jgi:tRNA(Glu) U13 pseudouridine synthase TruD
MRIPAIDLGLMAEHLAAHEGVLYKLGIYHQNVQNKTFRNILKSHINTLRNHVAVMLMLIDPNRVEKVNLPDIQQIEIDGPPETLKSWEKNMALESRFTANSMGTNNFNSAAMMKNENVKNIHLQMAYQDIQFQKMYNKLIASADFVPMALPDMQWMTVQKYQHLVSHNI